jgi:nucleotide-binding universal stress UspA family protein
MFKHILIPVDGAEDSWRALRQAIELAKLDPGAKIYGMYVIEPTYLSQPRAYFKTVGGVITSPEVNSQHQLDTLYERWGRQVLREMAERCRLRSIPCETHIHRGPRLKGIAHHATDADVVVLPSTDVSTRGSMFGPPRLEQVYRAIRRPLVLVLGYARPIERLLVCYDGGRQSKEALNVSARLASLWELPLLVVSVEGRVISPDKELPKAERYLGPFSVDAKFIARRGNVASEIASVAEEENADLIIMGVYRHGFLRRSLLGSTLDQLIRVTLRPVLLASAVVA